MKTLNDKINAASRELDEHIVRLLESGATYQRTAELAGCSISKVQYVARQRGLKRRKFEVGEAE